MKRKSQVFKTIRFCLHCKLEFKISHPRQLYCHTHKNQKRIRFRRNLKTRVYDLLGNRCSNRQCAWINSDGSRGCSDRRCLQVDHIMGGGVQERKKKFLTTFSMYFDVIKNPHRYQLLCANCNWIKRFINSEVPNRIDEVAV